MQKSPPTSSIYDAQELGEGMRIMQQMLPKWACPCLVVGGVLAYVGMFRCRLAMSKWRRKEKEAERCSSHAPSVFGNDDDLNDASILTYDEVEEFRRSLGIVLPRDEDLMAQIEAMLLDDPIPEGWELFRCSFGVRFRNTTTNTLAFFHPDAHALELHVRQELAQRDAESHIAFPTPHSAGAGKQMFDRAPHEEDDTTHQTTFANIFNAFLRKAKDGDDDTQSISTPRRQTTRPQGSMRQSVRLGK